MACCGNPNATKMNALHIFYVCLGLFCGFGSIALGIASVVHNDWIQYTVDKNISTIHTNANTQPSLLKADIIYYNRVRGLFYESITDEDDKKNFKKTDTDNSRAYLNLGETTLANVNYALITNLRKCHIGLFISAIGATVFTMFIAIGALVYFCRSGEGEQLILKPISLFCGIVLLLAVISYFLSYVIFHMLMDYERYLVMNEITPKIYSQWEQSLKQGTQISYHAMYYAGWAALLLVIIAAIIFLTMHACCRSSRYTAKQAVGHHRPQQSDPYAVAMSPLPPGGNGYGYGNNSPPTMPRYEDGGSQHSLVSASGAHRLPRHQIQSGGGAGQDNPIYNVAGGSQHYHGGAGAAQRSDNNIYRIY